MVFRASKEFQGRLVTADLQATTDLQATHLILMSMGIRVFQNAQKSKDLRERLAKYVVIHN